MLQGSVWPLVAAAIAAMIVGYVWYHPWFLGAPWMRQSGVTPETAERGARRKHAYMAISFLAFFIVAGVLRIIITGLGITGIAAAMRLGLLVSLVAMAVLLGSVLWEHRPFTLYLINAGYWVVALVAMAIILVV